MATFRWGVFGTGAISYKFARGLASARDAEVAFVASRSLDRARTLAAAISAPLAIQGYAEALASAHVDAVYIATPPSEHARQASMCLDAGIPVLVEKPFAANREEAEQVINTARSQEVFAMEAMWTRFLPAASEMRDRVRDGSLGEVRAMRGSFGMSWTPERSNSMFDPRLGGGALSHLGAYPLSLAQWMFGTPLVTQAIGKLGPTGVDEDIAMQLMYPDQVLGSFVLSLRAWAPDDLHVLGSNGLLGIRGSIVRPHGLNISGAQPLVYQTPPLDRRENWRQSSLVHQLAQRLDRSGGRRGKPASFRYAGNGYQYEADAVRASIEAGRVECDVMPLADTLSVASTMDQARQLIHSTA